jgi:hypothetical protein
VASHLNFERDIVPLLCVCKKMTLKVLRELCYITGYYPDADSCTKSCPWIELKPPSFYLHLLSISYTSSWWWRIVKNPFPIHRLMINLKYKVISSEPLSTLWDLLNLNSLVIKMSKRFDQNEQVHIYDSYSWTDKPLLKSKYT